MTDQLNEKPIVADLLYAVVVGYALSQLPLESNLLKLSFLIAFFVFVFEDFINYYKYVRPHMVDAKKYSFHSILVEFSILVTWSLSFRYYVSGELVYILYFVGFFIVRWYAGTKFFITRSNIKSRGFFAEQCYLIGAILGSLAYFYADHCDLSAETAFPLVLSSWAIAILLFNVINERLWFQRS